MNFIFVHYMLMVQARTIVFGGLIIELILGMVVRWDLGMFGDCGMSVRLYR